MVSLANLTVVVVSYGSSDLVRACVDSLVATEVDKIVVWDNSESPNERLAIAELRSSRVEVVTSPKNVGFGAGNNLAAELVRTEFVAFLNPDCQATTSALRALLDTLASDQSIGVVAPRMLYPNGIFGFAGGSRPSLLKEVLAATRIDDAFGSRARSILLRVYATITRRRDLLVSTEDGGQVELDWVSGFCMVQRMSVFRAVGGFDDRFFLYFEDVDYCDRLRTAGYRVVLDRTVSVLHHESASTGTRKSSHYWSGLATYFQVRGANVRAWGCRRIAVLG